MKDFNDLLLELYRLAQNAPAPEFQTQAMDRMREVLDFDSAFWATGVVEPDVGVTAHTSFLYRQPLEMLESWVRINQRDELAFEAFRQQGTTINAALCGADWQARFSPEGRKHINRYGMAHGLATIIAEPVLQIWTGVSFYRADPQRPFTEHERLLQQNLTPHLSEAWNISRFAFVDSARNGGMPASQGRAICDAKGVLYNADRNFTRLMIAEWPKWKGPHLPTEVLMVSPAIGSRRYVGRRTSVAVETLHGMELLTARERSAIDELSSREYEVATLFAKGADYRAIASTLHLSPMTVRNHLQNVYTKLSISNKIQLLQIIQGG